MTAEDFEYWLWEFAFAYDSAADHHKVLKDALADFHGNKTCANCAHSTSTDPKCGLCAGPNATITRWIKHET